LKKAGEAVQAARMVQLHYHLQKKSWLIKISRQLKGRQTGFMFFERLGKKQKQQHVTMKFVTTGKT